MDRSPESPYRRLRRQMLQVLLLFGLAPLFAIGVTGYMAQRQQVETGMRDVLQAMVKNRKATVELFLEEKLRELELAAESMSVAELSKPAVLEALRDRMRRERGGIVDLGLIDETGRHVAYVGPYSLLGVNYRDQAWFQQVMVLGRYESDVFLGFRRFPHMVMAVKKREGGHDFILRATIDTDLLSALVREGGLESQADVFILNRAGEYQTQYSDDHRLMEKADLGAVPLHSGVRIVEGRQRSRHEFIATAWLHGESWVLVARKQMPGALSLAFSQPGVLLVLVLSALLVPVLSVLVVRVRLQQIKTLEAERGALYESVAQSEKMAAIGRLAATVAHEINNPLAIIQAQVGVLLDYLEDNPDSQSAKEFRERLKKIEGQVDRGRKVTHRLLGFSRRIGPDIEPVDVQAALEEAVGFVEKEAEAAGTRFVRNYEPDIPIIRSSLAQMQQVFLNLVNNAIDAMGHQGQIRLSIRPAHQGVEVQVADNGPGISPKDLEKVFQPFFSTKGGGGSHSGLGLAICKEAMQNLGGKIAVESALGKGTTFTLWFPVDIQAAQGR
ncbi:MAG: ATP-binding protein [Acidobacteriota bacterium]